ncbi:MAG: bifunctional serine/threonine-protein kinase/formylglycine-generating enzyme family protein [Planctomycetaceae bacterium]
MDQMGRPGSDTTAQTIVGSPAAGDDDSDDERADLSFLNPSSKPGSIGRLGHYEILRVLGQGAFGIVFKAFDEKLHRHVAIKAMNPQLASTSPPRKRFLREARSVAALKHENVVQIYSVEEEPLPYLAMEFVDGGTLADKLNSAGPLDVSEILYIGRQMAAGLAAAHEKGLIHRDIKPGNILIEVGAEQKVKITDFGLARAADDATMTRTGTIAGTPMYMAPEQAMGQTLDHRADLFSLGSVMYQMACGRPPFRGASAIAVLKRVVDEDARPIEDILPEVPDWLCTIIAKLHAKNPDDRFQTAKEVVDLLGRCLAELQTSGKVTCVQSSLLTPRDEPSPAEPSINNRPSTNQSASPPANTQPSGTVQGSSRRSETATFKRPILFLSGILATAAIITAIVINRGKDTTNAPITEIGNQKSKIENPSWHGWPADAPKPAIAPFNAEQARQHQDAWAKYLKIDVEYTNSIGMKFRLIPPGEFTMGSTADEIDEALRDFQSKFVGEVVQWAEWIKSEAPQHKVILTQPIYMGVNEVTQAEYEKVMGVNPSYFAPMGEYKEAVAGLDTTSHPVEWVSWNDAAEFCAKLSKQEELKPFYVRAGESITPLDGTGYRLPTEAEWEYACRAGTTTKFWIGDQDEELVRAGWFGTNSGGRTHAVGELKVNPYGLFDIHGNVHEWVEDWWEPTYHEEFQEKPAINPGGPSSAGSQRVVRAGGYNQYASISRAAHRITLGPHARRPDLGFRVALVAGVSRVSRP